MPLTYAEIEKQYKYFVFDLDNTLYNEEDYLFAAYKAISYELGGQNTLPLYQYLVNEFKTADRTNLFNKAIREFNLPDNTIQVMLRIMRTVKVSPLINLTEPAQSYLLALTAKARPVFIVTNGNVQQQKNKVLHLNWNGLNNFIEIVFANDFTPKPHPAAMHYLVEKFGVDTKATIYIGDTDTDEQFAANSGVHFAHINQLAPI